MTANSYFNAPYKDVEKVRANYRNNKDIPFITNSGVIHTNKLEDFLNQVKKLGANAVKIYLFREELQNPLIHKTIFIPASSDYAQVSFLFVPHDDHTGMGNDIQNNDNTILCLYPGGEGSGLCPPACGGGDQ